MNLTFVGRDDFLRDLLKQLDRGSVLLEGARGIGKTRVLEWLDEHPPRDLAVLRFDLQGVSTAEQLVERVAGHVHLRRNRVEDWLAAILGDWRAGDPWVSLAQLLAQRAPSRCIVLLDEVQTYLDHLARAQPDRARADLGHLDGLRRISGPVRFVLTGSITLAAVARRLGDELSPDWIRMRLGPLDSASGEALFVENCSGACADETSAAAVQRAGGYPRWIKRLAQATTGSPDQLLGLEHLDVAMERLFDAAPFALDLGHLERHVNANTLRRALVLAAEEGANRVSILAGLQRDGLTRPVAEQTLAILRDEFYLDDAGAFTLPLLAAWLRRRG